VRFAWMSEMTAKRMVRLRIVLVSASGTMTYVTV